MKRWFALSAIGRDRPGIVAELAELVYEQGCNLEDSSMTVLGGEFAVLLSFSSIDEGVEKRLATAAKKLEWQGRLTIFVRELEGEPLPYGHSQGRSRWSLVAKGIDKAGIVARVTRALAERDVTIRSMKTASVPGAESGTPIYTMRIEVDVPPALDVASWRGELEDVADELVIEITLAKA